MTSLQAGQRALSLSANVRMVSTTFIRNTGCTGILRLLLLGIVLPSVLVSGQSTTLSSSSSSNTATSATAAPSSTTQPPTSATTGTATTTMASTTISGSTATSTTQASTSATSMAATTIQSSTMTSSSTATTAMTTSQAPTTSGSTGTATAQSTTSGVSTIGMAQSSTSSMTSGSGSTSMMSTNQTSNSTGGMNGTTTSNNTSMSMINCPSFTCNYSDCYTIYNNQSASTCTTDAYCQLIRQADMCYTVGCSASCVDRCVNASQINCSVSCCNSTGCLNASFASMMMTTTTVISTTTTTTTTTQATTTTTTKVSAATSATTANNGKKCHKGKCNGTTCYTSFGSLETCTSSQPHCQLKKETINSILQWTAGCTTNCSSQTTCKTGTTQASCHLECCNATVASCLWLNGTLNVPSFATRGPHLNTELIASLLCLLAITLLL